VRAPAGKAPAPAKRSGSLSVFLIPCSCGTSFAVAEDYDRNGMHLRSFLLPCPGCGKRHDPRNRLLRLGYQQEGFWTVDESDGRPK
jgi:hypothetical protein